MKDIVSNAFLLFVLLAGCNSNNIVVYHPIGYFSSDFTLKTGAPRQGILVPESKGVIVLDTVYENALTNVNDFEYIWILSHFHQANGWDSFVNPPKSEHQFGLFATRSPRRPNPIGLSLIKLDSIVKNKLYVSGVDLFDQTPILDIKPFLPSIDYVVSEKNMLTEILLGHHNENFIADTLVKKFVLGDTTAVKN